MRVNKKQLHLTPAFALPALWGRETKQIGKFGKVSSIFVCFLLCEGEGAQPGVAADICCWFLLRETQPGANSLPNPACVLRNLWSSPPPGEDAATPGPLAGHRVFWAQAPVERGSSCFRSPCQPVVLIAFSSLKTLPQSSAFWQISCSYGFPPVPHQPAFDAGPLLAPPSPQSGNMLIFIIFFPKMGRISFSPVWKLFFFSYFNFPRRGGARGGQTLPISPPGRSPQTPCPAASPRPTKPCHFSQGRTKPRGKAGLLKGAVGAPSCSQNRRKAEHHLGEEKSVPTSSAAGLARPRRWLVGGRHGPRSLHPPYGEGVTQPLVSNITAACHLTVHLVAL